MTQVHLEHDGALAVLTLDNQPQNRIGDLMIEEFASALKAVADSGARALLLTASGEDFSFGGDIEPWPGLDKAQLRATFERYLQVFNSYERLPIPTVAAVQGLCFGGGLELAVRSDLVFAAESAAFGHPEQTLGIVTLLGGVYRMAERVGRAKAAEWAFTTQRVPASTMAEFGVVNQVFNDDTLVSGATEYAHALAAGPTAAHAAHKALLRAWAVGGVAAADEAIFDIAMPLWDTADVQGALPAAVAAYQAGQPREPYPFQGR